ncbi:cyclic diguanylate phosphodiesterase domain protein [Burkholderia pseudomallei]|nr:cyclic diguanylate phosphodiesterase domain protein [Burkholderia pseudomallei]
MRGAFAAPAASLASVPVRRKVEVDAEHLQRRPEVDRDGGRVAVAAVRQREVRAHQRDASGRRDRALEVRAPRPVAVQLGQQRREPPRRRARRLRRLDRDRWLHLLAVRFRHEHAPHDRARQQPLRGVAQVSGLRIVGGAREHDPLDRVEAGMHDVATPFLRALGEAPPRGLDARRRGAARVLERRGGPAEAEALHEIDVGVHQDLQRVFVFDALREHHRARVMQHRDEMMNDPMRVACRERALEDRAVELHDVGLDLPDAVEVREAGAEIVDRDQEVAVLDHVDRAGERDLVARRLLDHFEHDARRRQREVRAKRLDERARRDAGVEHLRQHVQEQPARARVLRGEVRDVQAPGQPIEQDRLAARLRTREQRVGRNRRAVRVGRAGERLIADDALVRDRDDRLKGAGKGDVVISHTPACVAAGELRNQAFGREPLRFRHVVSVAARSGKGRAARDGRARER